MFRFQTAEVTTDDDALSKPKTYYTMAKRYSSFISKLGFFSSETEHNGVGFEMEADCVGDNLLPPPTHLIIMVNGIVGSASNWRYAAKQFTEAYPRDVFVHCSECNYSMLTFEGVDVMGERLANEVRSVVKLHSHLQKISFVSHSLGGLISRYAIARLYQQDPVTQQSHEEHKEELKGKIAGLDPINFITSATPHLGSRAHQQLPLLFGFYTLERIASLSSWLFGRTGKHLFLTDSDDGKPPLLLRMIHDYEDLPFLSALQSFKRRVAYANSRSDHLVGWCTSSLRRPNELPQLEHLGRNEKYPHIVNVEPAEKVSTESPVEVKSYSHESSEMEEENEMIRGLTKMSWERIDVSFSGMKHMILAHSTIQVKNDYINYEGADVIQHMIDNFLL